MAKLSQVCRHIRSKNAGPFWVTFDLFFDGEENFRRYRDAPALGAELFGSLYGIDSGQIKRVPVDRLQMIKISFPRLHPQGWRGERDMHSGQQFVRLLDVEVG